MLPYELVEGKIEFVQEHVIGVAKGCDDEMIKDLNAHFMGECTEVGMYLAMSRQADREGYPEIAEAFKRYAWEEAEHAAKFAELLGDVVWDTKTNLEKRMNAESGACADKFRIAKRAKELNLDAIHDTVHEMSKDEARHFADCMDYLDMNKERTAYWLRVGQVGFKRVAANRKHYSEDDVVALRKAIRNPNKDQKPYGR